MLRQAGPIAEEAAPDAAEKRKRLTKKRKLELYLAQGGRCYECGEKRELAELDDDHRLPLHLGGTNDLANRKLICRATCHRAKSARETKARGKVNRLRERRQAAERGEEAKSASRWPKGRKLQGQGFPKAQRPMRGRARP